MEMKKEPEVAGVLPINSGAASAVTSVVGAAAGMASTPASAITTAPMAAAATMGLVWIWRGHSQQKKRTAV